MTAKNMDVTRINLLHKIWCNMQKNDHMMATLVCLNGNGGSVTTPASITAQPSATSSPDSECYPNGECQSSSSIM
jgi:hypothetical protein